MITYPQGSPQQRRVVIQRVLEAINTINDCLPTDSGAQAATAGLINSCTDFETAVSVLSLQLQAAICWLSTGGGGENCEWPSECPFYTVHTLDPTPGLNIYDSRAKGFYFPTLVTTNGGVAFSPFTDPIVQFYPMSFLETINFPVLHDMGGDMDCIGHPVLASFLAPLLATVGGSVNISSNPSLTTIDISSLATVGGSFSLDGNEFTDFAAPALTSVGADFGVSNDELVNVSLPLLQHVGGNFGLTGAGLTDYTLPALTSFGGTNFSTINAALSVTTVNYLLVLLNGLGLTGVTIDLVGGTSATPTGAGAAAKAALILAGNTVNTN